MKQVLLIAFLSLPLGLVAHDQTSPPPLPKLGAPSQVTAGSFRIRRSESQHAARPRRPRGETRRQRMIVLHAMIALTSELNREAEEANQQEQQN